MNVNTTLARLINNCEQKLMQKACIDSVEHSMIFTGIAYESLPSSISKDPLLRPIDKIIYYNIWIFGKENGQQQMAFPSYEYLCTVCNVARATVASSLKKLRIYGLLTLARRVRDVEGKHRGNIYIINPEPASIAAILEYDHSYISFLEKIAQEDDTQHLAKFARARLQEKISNQDEHQDALLDTAISASSLQPTAALASHNSQMTIKSIAVKNEPLLKHINNSNVLATSRVQNLNSVQHPPPEEPDPSSKIELGSKFEPVQKLNRVVVVNNKNTTTTYKQIDFQKLNWGEQLIGIKPEITMTLHRFENNQLQVNEQLVSAYQITDLTEYCQFLLDELNLAIKNKAGTKYPIQSANSYLFGMINKINNNEYSPNGGYSKVQLKKSDADIRERRLAALEEDNCKQHIRRLAKLGQDLQTIMNFGYSEELVLSVLNNNVQKVV